MTIANVQGIAAASASLATGVSRIDSSTVTSFSSVMSQAGYEKSYTTSTRTNTSEHKDAGTKQSAREDGTNARQEVRSSTPKRLNSTKSASGQQDGKESQNVQTQATDDDTVLQEDISGNTATIVDQVLEVIQQMLGITQEELQGILEQLNLESEMVMEPDTVVQIVVEQTGCDTPMDLLADEDLSQLMKSLMESINQLKEQIAEQPENTVMMTETESGQDKFTAVWNQSEQSDTLPESGDTEETIVEGVRVSVQNQMQNASEEQTFEQPSRETPGNPDTSVETRGTGVAQNIFANLAQAVAKTQSASYSGMQAMDIVTQIVEEIKTLVKGNTTSMELQLHPESLGRVQIQLVAREGAITAQISAQTEAARHAIESQLSTLKESFQNQGLKVEAVEVTLQPQGFNMQQQQNFEGQQQSSKAKRQIRLEDVDLQEDELTEEESIAVDMMQRNGNQVDFSA